MYLISEVIEISFLKKYLLIKLIENVVSLQRNISYVNELNNV